MYRLNELIGYFESLVTAAGDKDDEQVVVPIDVAQAILDALAKIAKKPQKKLRRIIRDKDLYQFTGLKHTQIEKLRERCEFPKSFNVTQGGRAKGVFDDEIAEWQDKLKRDGTDVE